MKEERQEHIIKDLLYEASARKYLNASGQKSQIKIYSYIAMAASIILLIAYLGIQNFSSEAMSQEQLFSLAHEFPKINKSRSGDINKVDEHIDQIRQEEYATVLSYLEEEPLSQKDRFVKAHLLLKMDLPEDAERLVHSTEWDEQYEEEILWLDFLIQGRLGKDYTQLQQIASSLSPTYSQKAKEVLDKIKD